MYAPGVPVRSPTFALVNEYKNGKKSLFHFDMYRIESEDDLDSIGFYDYLDRPGVCLVEWSEKIPFALPTAICASPLKRYRTARPTTATSGLRRFFYHADACR